MYGEVPFSDYKSYSEINCWLLIILLILEILGAIYLLLWKCFGKRKQRLGGESPMISDRGKVVPIGELLLEMPKNRIRVKADKVKEWGLPKELGFMWEPDQKTWGLPDKLGPIEKEGGPKQKNTTRPVGFEQIGQGKI
jgi:hypothetical protein